MENKTKSEFVSSRSCFKDKTLKGEDKLCMYLGVEDIKQLQERIQATASADGVKLEIYVREQDGKTRGSILVKPSEKSGKAGGPSSRPATSFQPKKTFAFKPKV